MSFPWKVLILFATSQEICANKITKKLEDVAQKYHVVAACQSTLQSLSDMHCWSAVQ